MAKESTINDMKMFAVLLLGLFLIAIITGVTYIGVDYLKATLCTQAANNQTTSNVWENGVCYNESTEGSANLSARTSPTITAITKIAVVELSLDLALGLLALVVLMLIFKIVIRVAKSFGAASL